MSLDKKSKMIIVIVTAATLLLLISGLGYQKFSKSNKIKTFNKYINITNGFIKNMKIMCT